MDVKACDNCKKTNLETSLLVMREFRRQSVEMDADYRIASEKPDAPIKGFSVSVELASRGPAGEYPSGVALLCRPCTKEKVEELLVAL